MINISDSAKTIYQSDILPGSITMLVGDQLYPSETLYPSDTLYPKGLQFEDNSWVSGSLKITEALCSKETLDFASVESNVLEVELASVDGNYKDLLGQSVYVYQTVGQEQVPLGTFTVASTELEGDYFTKIKAYDDMQKFIGVDITDWWNTGITFPITIYDLLIALCKQVGVAYDLPDTWTNSTVSVKQTSYVESMKASDLLGMIQEACGLFFHTDRHNKLVVFQSKAPETSIPYTDLLEDAMVSDYTVPAITGVQIKATDKDTGALYGDNETVYQIIGNYLLMGKEESELKDIAKNVLANIGNRSYKPFSAKVKARNYVEIGDIVRITTYKGTTTAAPLLSRKMSDDGLITDEIAAKGKPHMVNKPRSNRKILQVYSQKMHEVEETLDGYKSTFEEIKTTQTEHGKLIADSKSEWQQTASGISQSVELQLKEKANISDVNKSLDDLSDNYSKLKQQITNINQAADSIKASVKEVDELAKTTKEATAALTLDGLSVDTGQTTKSVVDGNGLTITAKSDNSVVAKFTTGESEIQNLKIDGYMKLGAHTIQKMQDTEWDGTIVNGTGWMWNGG